MACWQVSLVDSAGTTLDSTVTDRNGDFRFMAAHRPALRLRVRQTGLIDHVAELGPVAADAPADLTLRIPLQADSAHRSPTRGRRATATPGGTVYYTFVVDTLGRVDVPSAFLVSAPSPALAQRVERGLASMRFSPWTPASGQTCRRVVQPFVIAPRP